MKLFLILLIVTLAFAAPKSNQRLEGRIISGKNALKGQLPWQVLIKRADEVWCGGSVISENWVLTAAHCTDGLKSLDLIFGIINVNEAGVRMKATEFVIHDKYNDNNLNNDVSLIRLPQPLKFSDTIRPIALNKNDKDFVGQLCTVAGFGLMSDEEIIHSENLLYTNVDIISKQDCEKSYEGDFITDATLCTIGSNNSDQSICSGDSGGALVIYDGNTPIQIGINSFVADDICTEKIPAGYVKISSPIIKEFIIKTANINL